MSTASDDDIIEEKEKRGKIEGGRICKNCTHIIKYTNALFESRGRPMDEVDNLANGEPYVCQILMNKHMTMQTVNPKDKCHGDTADRDGRFGFKLNTEQIDIAPLPRWLNDDTLTQYVEPKLKDRYIAVSERNDKKYVYSFDGKRWSSMGGNNMIKDLLAQMQIIAVYYEEMIDAIISTGNDDEEVDSALKPLFAKQKVIQGTYRNIPGVNRLKEMYCIRNCLQEDPFNNNHRIITYKDGYTYDMKKRQFRKSKADDNMSFCVEANHVEIPPEMPAEYLEYNDKNGLPVLVLRNAATCDVRMLYDVDGLCPGWTKALRLTHDGRIEDIRFFQKIIGSSLWRHVMIRAMVYMMGKTGHNGKTTIINFVCDTLGDFSTGLKSDYLSEKRDDKDTEPDTVKTVNKAVAVCDEPSKAFRMSDTRLKPLTGHSRQMIRTLYKEPFEFEMSATIIAQANFPPTFSGSDNAQAARIIVIPYEHRFDKDSKEVQKESKKWVEEMIPREHDGLMAWIIEGLTAYDDENIGNIDEWPEMIRIATQEYIIDNDSIGAFLAEVCEEGSNKRYNGELLYTVYFSYCRYVLEKTPIGKTNFKSFMQGKGYEYKVAKIGGKSEKAWVGLAVKDGIDIYNLPW